MQIGLGLLGLGGNFLNRGILKMQCFAPSTLVDTPQGKRAISEIGVGEQVYAFDFAAGQWVARAVTVKHDNRYQGAWITLHTSGGTIECTAYHPFWVTEGYALNERPRCRELAEREDESQQLAGRWVNSHDLMAGDVLIGRDGRQIRLLKIEQQYVEEAPICNLTIDHNHSFAVGNDGLLVHNTAGCSALSAKGVHDTYLNKVIPGAKEKSFKLPWNWGRSGTRRLDHFDKTTGTGFEANTTPWDTMTLEQLARKLDQVAGDFALLKTNPKINRMIWFGTEELPMFGLGGQLREALEKAGIPYWVINP